MTQFYGVKLLFGGWWNDADGGPMCGRRSVVFAKLKRDRQNPELAAQLQCARVVPVVRTVTLQQTEKP